MHAFRSNCPAKAYQLRTRYTISAVIRSLPFYQPPLLTTLFSFFFRHPKKRKIETTAKSTGPTDKTTTTKSEQQRRFVIDRTLVKIPTPPLKLIGSSSMTITRTMAPQPVDEVIEVKDEPEEADDFEEVFIDGTETGAGSTSAAVSSSDEVVVFMCKACKMYFPMRRMLEIHNSTVHNPLQKTTTTAVTEASPPTKVQRAYRVTKNRTFQCNHCTYSSQGLAPMNIHVMRKHPNALTKTASRPIMVVADANQSKPEEPDEDDESSWPMEVIEEEEECMLLCRSPPSKKAKKVAVKREEIEEETEEESTRCHYCPFQGYTRSDLEQHIKRKHRSKWLVTIAKKVAAKAKTPTPFQQPLQTDEISCPCCPYTANTRSAMNRHLMREHNSRIEGEPEFADVAQQEEIADDCEEIVEEDVTKVVDEGDMFEEVVVEDVASNEVERLPQKPRAYQQCPHCPFRAFASATLKTHLSRRHAVDPLAAAGGEVAAVQSARKRVAASLSNHRKLASTMPVTAYACHYCNFAAATVGSINSHSARLHFGQHQPLLEIPVEEFDCDQCDVKTRSRKAMQGHLKRCHLAQANSDGMFVCTVCSYETLSRMGLQRHISMKHNKARCDPATDSYKCEHCDFASPNAKIMEWHKYMHADESTSGKNGSFYSCNDCEFSTWAKTQLFSHIKRKHKDGEDEEQIEHTFICQQCDYSTKNKHSMKVHVIRKHTSEFNHECETCGKKYKVKADLTNHIRFQHREQPIICDVCGKTCRNSNLLYLHQKFAHYKPEFECPICHRRMVSQANLDEHILKQHEQLQDVVCDECGKTFKKVARLKIHKRTHTGVKPYTCKICLRAFARRNGLRQHLLIHTGQRPYVCDICDKSFTQKTGLISHRKSHPGSHPPLPRVTIDHVLSDLLDEE